MSRMEIHVHCFTSVLFLFIAVVRWVLKRLLMMWRSCPAELVFQPHSLRTVVRINPLGCHMSSNSGWG